jgi:translation elongation factor EF-Tu-like GTPase
MALDLSIRVVARISVLTPEAGGRSTPFTTGYSPNHNFGAPDGLSFHIGRIEVPSGAWIHPGETRDLVVHFIGNSDLAELIQVGRTWLIQEATKHVATGEILTVLPSA